VIRFPNTLAFRLTFWYAIVVIASIAIAFSASYYALKKTLYENMHEDMAEGVLEFKVLYENEGLAGVKKEIDREASLEDVSNFFFQLLDADGAEVYSSDLTHWPSISPSATIVFDVIQTGEHFMHITNTPGGSEAMVIYGAISSNFVLHTGEVTEEIQNITRLLSSVFTSMMLILIPFASIICWLMAKHAAKDIEIISFITSEIEKGNLEKRVPLSAKGREIEQLSNTFNAMLDKIQALMKEMQEMIDNIAHDLRGPVARIRAIAEQMLSNDLHAKQLKPGDSEIIMECDRLIHMINAGLEVARIESDAGCTNKQNVNIGELIGDACELFEAMAEQEGITLSYQLQDRCIIHGNIQNLQRMLANLLDNAIKFTEQGGKVSVTLSRLEDCLEIVVSDTGQGIPESDQNRVFDRFFRCDKSRNREGCGLGLSFSKAVAHAHGGSIELSSRINLGTDITIRLPISQPHTGNRLHPM